MDVEGAGSGAGGGGSGGDIGPVATPVSNMKSSSYTITSAGTTWINTTSTGNVGIDWTTFPWEFPTLFMNTNERIDLFNTYMFWKCNSVSVHLKNFRGYVNTVPAGATSAQTFPTDNAAIQTYVDELYYLGTQVAPFINENGWISETDLMKLVNSWQKGGYDATDRISLPIFDIPVTEQYENIISQNYPNVTQTQAVAGEHISKTWHTVGDKYWRCTSEFMNGAVESARDDVPASGNALTWPNTIRFFRVDQAGGITLQGSNDMKFHQNYFNAIDNESSAVEVAQGALPPCMYSTYEPIPALLLRIVPQHIEGNGNSTHVQFDFEIRYNISVRGRIPRHGYTGSATFNAPAFMDLGGVHKSQNRPGCATPIGPYYPSDTTAADKTSLLPTNSNDIQRGRTKNGFVYIPFIGWELTNRVAPAPPPAPTAYATKGAFDDRVHLAMYNDVLPPTRVLFGVKCYTDQGNYVLANPAAFLDAITSQGLWMVPTVVSSQLPGKTTLTLGGQLYAYCKLANGDEDPTETGYTYEDDIYWFTTTAPSVLPTPTVTSFDPSDARSVAAYLDSAIKAHLTQ